MRPRPPQFRNDIRIEEIHDGIHAIALGLRGRRAPRGGGEISALG
jgi:hypothetical protein